MSDDKQKELMENKLRVKKYLGLENVSFLTGAGTSFHLGAPVIREIPEGLKKLCQEDINAYFGEDKNPSYEDLFNCLQADRFVKKQKGDDYSKLDDSIRVMQQWLFDNCNTENISINDNYKNDEKLNRNKYHYHESLIKKILQRPNNLRRANLFTTNYDMAFDYALDNLGVHYINGFIGVHNRCFRPEVYDYDLYYPGQSVTGKVHRAEKVLKYYKMHGSLSWVATERTHSNTYGIKEISLNKEYKIDSDNELMIYPCATKKSFTLDLPYSELFRQFSQAINQPQSVLFCLGYSFFDEHINDIISQALSIPSFTLFVVNYSPEINVNSPIGKLKALNDKRIRVIQEDDLNQSTFTGFVDNILPDLYEEEENMAILETMKKLFPNSESEKPIETPPSIVETKDDVVEDDLPF